MVKSTQSRSQAVSPPEYTCALLFTDLVVSRQPVGYRREMAESLQGRIVTMIADNAPPTAIDAELALFDCMFSGLQVRDSLGAAHRLVGRAVCELCGSSVKIHEGLNEPPVRARRWRTCRSCGVRSESPSDWEPILLKSELGCLRLELPDGNAAAMACAAVVTNGAWVAEDRVTRAIIRRYGEVEPHSLNAIPYVGCPVFLRVAVASAGRQSVLFARALVGDGGIFALC